MQKLYKKNLKKVSTVKSKDDADTVAIERSDEHAKERCTRYRIYRQHDTHSKVRRGLVRMTNEMYIFKILKTILLFLQALRHKTEISRA